MKTLLFALLLPFQAHACLWLDGTTLGGGHRRVEGHHPAAELRYAMAKASDKKIEELVALRRDEKSSVFFEREVQGVRDVLGGRYDAAIGTFSQLETEYPGHYSTAVNLGTAYELKGELELALQWIREGIRRNPESHMGSEWLHVEILKTRMTLRDDPDYLRQNHVIRLPESYSGKTSIPIGNGSYTVDQIADSILYQLHERMIFVKPPDPVVADLLFTFGAIEGRTNVVESGLKLFEMANEYGFANPGVMTQEIERYEKAIRFGEIRRIGYIVLAVLAVVLLLVIAYRKEWFFLTGAGHRRRRIEKRLSCGD